VAKSRRTPWPLAAAFFIGCCGAFCGCGGEQKTGLVEESPQAKAADQGAQNGMQEFMKGKTGKGKKPKS